MKVNINQFVQRAAAVNSLVQDVRDALPDSELAEELENNYEPLHSMILDLATTLDVILSDVEK